MSPVGVLVFALFWVVEAVMDSLVFGEDADDFIGHAVDGAYRMRTLINDLLLYSLVGTRGKALSSTDSQEAFEAAGKNLEKTIEESGAVVVAGPLPVVQQTLRCRRVRRYPPKRPQACLTRFVGGMFVGCIPSAATHAGCCFRE